MWKTTVQILQNLETGKYDAKPDIDKYLREVESHTVLDEGLRVCAARLARSMYAIRSKRNILHKGSVDPNAYDQRMVLHGAEWLIAELLRLTQGLTMQDAGELIEMVHAPVGALVEDFGSRRLVLPKLSIEGELIVLLHSHYPAYVPVADIMSSLNRRNEGSVRNTLRALWSRKLVEGSKKEGYRLTQPGFTAALGIIRETLSQQP